MSINSTGDEDYDGPNYAFNGDKKYVKVKMCIQDGGVTSFSVADKDITVKLLLYCYVFFVNLIIHAVLFMNSVESFICLIDNLKKWLRSVQYCQH